MLLDITTFLGDQSVALPSLPSQAKYHRKIVERRITPTLNTIHVGVGEIGFSDNPRDVLRITALGSCVGLVLISKTPKKMNECYPTYLAHIMLPSRKGSQFRLRKNNDNQEASNAAKLRINEEMLVIKAYGYHNDANDAASLSMNVELSSVEKMNNVDKISHKVKSMGKYADVAIPFGISWFKKRGFQETQLEAYVIGGARMFPTQEGITGNIGALNTIQTLKELAKHDIKVKYVYAGGITRKAIIIFVKTGEIYVRDGDDTHYYRLK